MRILYPSISFSCAAAAMLFSACSGGSQIPSGQNVGVLQPARIFTPAHRVKPDKASYLRAVYVSDNMDGIVRILTNTYYRELGTIVVGSPLDETMDKLGNLYVVNEISPEQIDEYAPGATSPTYTYTAGISTPVGVGVDNHGNVYEGDFNGTINQYFQGSDQVTQSCTAPGSGSSVGAITVDSSGDVFVVDSSGGSTTIVEYKGGLSGCNASTLSFGSVQTIGGLTVDKNGNLIFSDTFGGVVDVVDPPYTTITRTIGSGFVNPAGVSLNRANKLVFVADSTNRNVTVVNYATGANVTVLGAEHGITSPIGVVDGPNAVY